MRVPGTCEDLDSPHVQPGWWAAQKPLSPSSVSAAPRWCPEPGMRCLCRVTPSCMGPPGSDTPCPTPDSPGARCSNDQAGPPAPQARALREACGTSNDHRDQGPLQPSEATPTPGAELRLPGLECHGAQGSFQFPSKNTMETFQINTRQ